MAKKILVWLDDKYAYLHYGICKKLSKLGEYEFYGFVSQKLDYDFLKKQNDVEFKELYYYSECYFKKSQKPDMNFLSEVEKKFNLNLWLLAYTERTFLEERNFFHKFNSDEILFIVESLLKLLLNFFDNTKPDFIIMQKTGENLANLLLFHIAKSIDIDTWMFTETRLENSFVLSNDLYGKTIKNEFEKIKKSKCPSLKTFDHEYIIKNSVSKMVHDYMNIEFGKSTTPQKIKRYGKRIFVNTEELYINRGKSKFKMLEWRIKHYFELKNRINFINQNLVKEIPSSNFVYFPLPVQPESQTNAWAPFQSNLLYIIENIARSIPSKYILAIKEHPAQASKNWRSIDFYQKIISLPNVSLIHPSVDNQKFLSNCKILLTINSSSGFEALFYKKPVIVFTDVFYDSVSMVKKINDFSKLPAMINELISSFTFSDFELSCLVSAIESKQYIIPYWKIMKDISNISSLNIHSNFDIAKKNLDEFLNKYDSSFSTMANAYNIK